MSRGCGGGECTTRPCSTWRQVSGSKLATDEQKKLIPYEEGLTLVEQAGTIRDPAEQKKLLDAATAKFEQFMKANPEHLLTPSAGTHLGNILVIRGRTLLEPWLGCLIPAKSSSKPPPAASC